MRYEVLVVGGGIIGLLAARELAARGAEVAVVDAGIEPGAGASTRNLGVLHPLQPPPMSMRDRLRRRGLRRYPSLLKELGVKARRVGVLVVATNRAEALVLRTLHPLFNLVGWRAKYLGAGELRGMEPGIRGEAALFLPEGMVVDPGHLIYRLAENLALNRIPVHWGVRVKRLLTRGGRVVGADTTVGRIGAETVVLAAGLGGAALAKSAGVDLPLLPGKGVMAVLYPGPGQPGRVAAPLPLTPSVLRTKGGAASTTPDGIPYWGPTLSPEGDEEPSAEEVQALLEKFTRLYRARPHVTRVVVGVRAIPRAGGFIIGWGRRGLYLLEGIQSPGLTAAPAIAEKAAEDVAAELGIGGRRRLRPNPPLGRMRDGYPGTPLCPLLPVSEEEARWAVRVGARTVCGVQVATGMWQCPCTGVCRTRVAEIIAEETGTPLGRAVATVC